MFSVEYAKDIVTFDEAQFAIAIAIAQLGENAAFKPVLYMAGTNTKYHGLLVPEIREERQRLNQKALEYNRGCVIGTIQVMWDNYVLECEDTGRHSRTKHLVRLPDLLSRASKQDIYNATMQLLSVASPETLLVNYMRLAQYRDEFEKLIKKNYRHSADGIRLNELNASSIQEILTSFTQWVSTYSAKAYEPFTCTPEPYLSNAFLAFYANSELFFHLLNTHGYNADAGTSDDSVSGINYYSISNEEETRENDADNFDFVDVARKINRASNLIFSHGGNRTAFYDIFSCYRDRLVRNKYQSIKNELEEQLKGCKIHYVDSAGDNECGHDGAVKNKKSGRTKLCLVFEPIIENGRGRGDIAEYWAKAIELTETLSEKDGIRLFSTKDHNTKHTESNSEILNIIIEGYTAAYELVKYLEFSKSYISLNNFPTIIFRDDRYLLRFRTLEEYVDNIKVVTNLVEEVEGDRNRSQETINGIYRNEKIWGYLGRNDLLNESIFRKLADKDLSYIKSAVTASKAQSHRQKFINALQCMSVVFDTLHTDILNGVPENKYTTLLSTCYGVGESLISPSYQEKSSMAKYTTVLSFLQTFREIMRWEQHPVQDKDGYYLWQCKTASEEMNLSLTNLKKTITSEKTRNAFDVYYSNRVKALVVAYECIFPSHELEDDLTHLELWKLMVISDALIKFIEIYATSLADLLKDADLKQDIYLLLVKIDKHMDLFNLNSKRIEWGDLKFLCNEYRLICRMRSNDIQELGKFTEIRNESLATAVQKFLNSLDPVFNDLTLAEELIVEFNINRDSFVGVHSKGLLRKASESLRTVNHYSKQSDAIRQYLDEVFNFDSLGYATINGQYFQFEDSYILDFGYLVKINTTVNQFSATLVDEKMLPAIINAAQFRSRI